MQPQPSVTKEAFSKRVRRLPKWASFIVLFLAVVVTPITILFLDNFITPAQSWFNPSWEYRMPVVVSNSGGAKSNYDVLITLDTAELISSGKILSNCNDIRFVDSDDETLLSYWIESGCNTDSTQIWARVPSLPDGGKTIYMYYGNGGASSGQESWGGKISMYSLGSCPSGWIVNSDAIGRFLRGSTSYGGISGSSSHTYGAVSCTFSATNPSYGANDGGVDTVTHRLHSHSGNVTIGDSGTVLPPYQNLVLCESSELAVKSGLSGIFESTPDGWTRDSDLDNDFLRVDTTAGGIGGVSTHSHTYSGVGSTTPNDSTTTSKLFNTFATGGVVTYSGGYTIHTFTSSGTFTNVTTSALSVEYLVVGGGGGGGSGGGSAWGGGGGGGGSVKTGTLSLSSGTFSVNIGNGGNGGTPNYVNGTNGGDTTFSTITSLGGGRGGSNSSGASRGTGGGGSATGHAGGTSTDGSGFSGGAGSNCNTPCRSGGGGGSASAGVSGVSGPGNGGGGVLSSIRGTSVGYGGGGGGSGGTQGGVAGTGGPGAGNGVNTGNAPSGLANRGGGGGGGGWSSGAGGNGGSGIVVVRYLTPGVPVLFPTVNHSHVIGSGNTSSSSNLPPFIDVLLASADSATNLPVNAIVITDIIPPLGWSRVSEFDGKFLKGSDTYGNTGGSDTHTHTVSLVGSSATVSGGYFKASQLYSPADHANVCTLDARSNLPPYLDVLYVKKVDNAAEGITYAIGSEESNAPASPSTVPAEALSTSSIRWNFVDNAMNEEGFKVVDSVGTVMATCVGENLTYCDETGLNPNTEYTRYIIAYNNNGDSQMSESVSRYTLSSVPSLAVDSVTTSDIDLAATGVTNLGVGMSALYFECLTSGCSGSVDIDDWITTTDASSSNLDNNTQYSFRLKARNGDGVETAYSSTVSVYTYATLPTISTSNVTSDSITVQVNNVPNLTNGQSGMYVVCDCNTDSTVPNTWNSSNQVTIGGFTPNSPATMYVKVRNGDGVETELSSPLTVYTRANTPLAPAVSDITSNSYVVRLNQDINSNPSSVEYSIRRGILTPQFINPSTGQYSSTPAWADYDTWNSGGGVLVSNLTEGSSTTIYAVARNSDGVATSPSGFTSFHTLLATPTGFYGESLGASSIRWHFTDGGANETGFKIYDAEDNLKVTCSVANISYCDETGLNPNESYERKVLAYLTGYNADSEFSNSETEVTHSIVPSITNITGDDGRVTFGIDMNGNPNGTEVLVMEEISGLYYSPVTDTLEESPNWFAYTGTPLEVLVQNLDSNARYDFKVKSRNSNEVESNFSSVSTVYTHASIPEITSLETLSNSSIKVVFNPDGNASTTEYVLREVNSGKYVNPSTGLLVSDPIWNTYSQFGESSGTTLTGLDTNTLYTFDVKARNSSEVETVYSSQLSIYTHANSPSIVSLTPSSSTVLVITVNDELNPAQTEFAVRENNSGLYVNKSTGVLQGSQSWGVYSEWGGETGTGITSLSPNSEYTFSVIARNGDDVNTSFSGAVSTFTFANVPGAIETTNTSVSTVNIKINSNGNPLITEYAVLNSTSSLYLDFTNGNESEQEVWGTYAQWGGDVGYQVTGLTSGTEYAFVAKARNSNGVQTSFGVESGATTSLNAPTIGVPVKLSDTSIQWNFTDNEGNESGYRVYDENGVQVAECAGVNISSCIEYGLTPNTEYTRKIAAYNQTGSGEFSDTVSKYTKSSIPNFSLAESESSTRIKLALTGNGNPSDTKYQIREVVSGLKVGNIADGVGKLTSSDSWYTLEELGGSNGVSISELFANAEYQFVSVSRDNEGDVSDNSELVTLYTLAVAPLSPTLTALSESRMGIVIDNGGNSEVTTFALVDVRGNRYYNFNNGSWELEPVWGTYTNWGRNTGITITGLGINTEYEFAVYAKNGLGVSSEISQTSVLYTLSNLPGRVVSTQVATTTTQIRLQNNQNPNSTEFYVLDVVSNRFVDPATRTLVSNVRWGRFADFGGDSGLTIEGLIPGGRYEFVSKSRNGNRVESTLTAGTQVYTLASIPNLVDPTTVSLRSVRLRISRNQNSPTVQYSVFEENLNRYVDFRTGLYVTDPVWGTYSEFGSDAGFVVTGLAPVTDYSFRVNARNANGVVTGFGARRIYGTNAKIENVPVGVSIRLRTDSSIDPSVDLGGQRGLHDVRIRMGDILVADVPIEFSGNRDWSGSTIVSDGNRVAVKFSITSGFTGTYKMYVPKGDTNRFKLCTKAESLEEVNNDCAGNVVFAGPYPQTIVVDEKAITVSTSVIEGVSYWVVSGLTGTGGLGETIDTGGEVVKEPADNEPEEEEPASPPPVINTPNQVFNNAVNAVIATVTQTTPAQAIDGVRIAIDNSPVGSLPEPQLTVVATTATAATVTVGIAALGGGFSSIPYVLTQFFLGVLSFLGFRKKGKPYGYVYDSISKEPISRAIVRIYDGSDKLVWTDVTDVYGSFNVELSKGSYKILVKKAGYTYPTVIIKGVVDYPIEPIYKGELLRFSKKEDLKVYVPMDPIEARGIKAILVSAKSTVNVIMKIFHIIVFVGGITLGAYTLYKFPSLTNFIVILFYIPAFILLFRSFFGIDVQHGFVKDQKGHPIRNIEIALKEMKFDRFVTKRITDALGRYRFVIYPGDYELVVISKEYKAMKFEGGSSVVSVTDKGEKIIAKDIVVRKK